MAGRLILLPWVLLYLAVVIELCSRRMVGSARADHLRASFVGDALQQALGFRSLVPEAASPLFRRDCGSPCGGGAFRQLRQTHKLTLRLSARANSTNASPAPDRGRPV